MSRLTPAMDTALADRRALIFGAIQIDLNDGRTIRLLDGSGSLDFYGATWTGKDGTFGTIGALESLSDGVGDEAPGLSLTLLPPSAAVAANLSAPEMQGSRIRMYLGAVVGGVVVASPQLLFDGELDTPELTASTDESTLELECVSALEGLFDNDEGARLSHAFHSTIWPGEEGLKWMTGTSRTVIWGPGERPAGLTYGSSYGGGGYVYSGGGTAGFTGGGGGGFSFKSGVAAVMQAQ